MSKLTASDIAFGIVLETTKAIETTQAMIRDANLAAHAKHTASQHTNCRQCQAFLENFILKFPDASEDAILEKVRESWETCGACKAEYNAHLERQAAEWEERQRGLEYAEEINGIPMHEKVNGGVK